MLSLISHYLIRLVKWCFGSVYLCYIVCCLVFVFLLAFSLRHSLQKWLITWKGWRWSTLETRRLLTEFQKLSALLTSCYLLTQQVLSQWLQCLRTGSQISTYTTLYHHSSYHHWLKLFWYRLESHDYCKRRLKLLRGMHHIKAKNIIMIHGLKFNLN